MYQFEYRRKLISAIDAAKLVQSDSIVDYGAFTSKPVAFDAALSRRSELRNVAVRATGTVLPLPQVLTVDTNQRSFQYFSRFFTPLDRHAAEFDLVAYLPVQYNEAEMWHEHDDVNLSSDIWVAQVTPMDDSGCFNFGLANFNNRSLALQARLRIVEINQTMPRCLGGNSEYLHVSEIDHIIEGSHSSIFASSPVAPPNREESTIARLIMEEIEDGSCLQLGGGVICNEVGRLIADSDLADLGIHSENFCDAYVTMHHKGRVSNQYKTSDKGKSVYSYCIGTEETYRFLHDNPLCASYNIEYTNDPQRIASNDRVLAISHILEIDLLSQACTESHGLRQLAGIGGQPNFISGSLYSRGGKSFLGGPSYFKDKNGKRCSRIRPLLSTGAPVTIPRSMIHYVVTEFGKVNVKGLSTWGRAAALIDLAHPDFREELTNEAKRMKLWSRTNRIPF